jgi:putative peptide zinc metalloprotease protein
MTRTTAPEIDDGTVLRIRPFTVVRQGDDFLVGDSGSAVYVVLPDIGVRVLRMLAAGRTIGDCTAAMAADGTDVDVADFAGSMIEVGLAEISAHGSDDGPADDGLGPERDQAVRPRWGRIASGPAVWTLSAGCAIGAVALVAVRPALFPSVNDIFFLSTPVRSTVGLILMTLVLRAIHEGCHWLAARAEGVRATFSVSRRLYLLVFETDLTRMWGLPRRRRFWPLLAGMAFDVAVLFVVLLIRQAANLGWWHPGGQTARVLAALTFIQIAGILPQFFVFLRTDVYGVLVTATGCFDLWRVTRLRLRQRLRLARPEHLAQVATAHPRDLAVARWFVWVYAAGLLFAGWFFVAYFVPATIRLVVWVVQTVAAADLGGEAFWEAIAFGMLLLSSRILTVWVAIRDALRRRRTSEGSTPAGLFADTPVRGAQADVRACDRT